MTIHGQVRSATGPPLAEARVYYELAPVAMPDVAALTDAAGWFTLATPADGTYRVGAACDGYAPAAVTVDVTASARAEVAITLEALDG